MTTHRLARRRTLVTVAVAVALLLVAAVVVRAAVPGRRHYTVYFSEVKGLYVGDSVDVLGVSVGKVTGIQASPHHVKVTIAVDRNRPIPADVRAVLVSPSLVAVRHVALAPAYAHGPTLPEGGVIPESRTAVPVEWDQVKDQLSRLSAALGPHGANQNGSLSRILDASAKNLGGEGGALNQTIALLSKAMSTLADSKGNIVGTIENLQVFISALEASNTEVYQFGHSLAAVSTLLSQDRNDLVTALKGINSAFDAVTTFVQQNRTALQSSVSGLERAANLLASNRQDLADILQVAPTTLSNFYNIADPTVPALTGSLVAENIDSPATFLCSAVYSLGQSPSACAQLLAPVAQYLRLGAPPVGLSGLENNNPDPSGGVPVGGQH